MNTLTPKINVKTKLSLSYAPQNFNYEFHLAVTSEVMWVLRHGKLINIAQCHTPQQHYVL